MGLIQTVSGDIHASKLGSTLMHEHMLWDLMMYYNSGVPPEKKKVLDEPIAMENLFFLRRNWGACRDNMMNTDWEMISSELTKFKSAGGGSVTCLDAEGLGRDVKSLEKISQRSGVNIIAGTGWYRAESHPEKVKRSSVDELAGLMVTELTEGIGDTGIRAGVIGELAAGCDIPFHEEEEKVFRAACRAHNATNAALTLHPAGTAPMEPKLLRNSELLKVWMIYADILEHEGADPKKFYMSHADARIGTLDHLLRLSPSDASELRMDYLEKLTKNGNTKLWLDHIVKLLERGITVSFDGFGMDCFYNYNPGAQNRSDLLREKAIIELVKMGYQKQIVLAHDICMKLQLRRYGGYGYSHILENVVPELRYWGVSEKQVRAMLVDNPARILSM